MATNTKECSITNNSGKDIALLTIVPTGETGSSNAIPIAGGNLEELKTSDGKTVLKNGSSAAVILDHKSSEGGQVQNYDLIAGDSTWLYPINLLVVSQQTDNGTTSYPSQTITQDGGTAMAQAELFYQTIAAYPNSQLCQDYAAALQAAKDAAQAKADGSPQSADAAASAIEDALGSFFKGTTSYNQVTLAHVAAVDAYHKQLPFAWARYKVSFTYYLYGTDGTSSLFVGALSMQKSGSVDVTRPNGGYTCRFVPAVAPADLSKSDVDNSRAINLTYSDGLFIDDPKVDNPKIALRGDYLLSRMFTASGDDNDIVTIVSGGVNGVSCIGLDIAQKSTTPKKPTAAATSSFSDTMVKYWDQLTHPKNMTDWVVSIMTLVGTVLLVPALASAVYGIYRIVKYKQQLKETIEITPIKERINIIYGDVAKARIKWALGNQVLPEYGIELLKNVADMGVTFSIKEALREAMAVQRTGVQKLLEYMGLLDGSQRTNLESVLTSIQTSEGIIAKNNFKDPNNASESQQVLKNEYQRFAKNQDTFEGIYKKVNEQIYDDGKQMIDQNMDSAYQIFEQLRKAQEMSDASDEETDPRLENIIEESE